MTKREKKFLNNKLVEMIIAKITQKEFYNSLNDIMNKHGDRFSKEERYEISEICNTLSEVK